MYVCVYVCSARDKTQRLIHARQTLQAIVCALLYIFPELPYLCALPVGLKLHLLPSPTNLFKVNVVTRPTQVEPRE